MKSRHLLVTFIAIVTGVFGTVPIAAQSPADTVRAVLAAPDSELSYERAKLTFDALIAPEMDEAAVTASPAQARYLQTDPIGYEDNINLYAYVGNDPINSFDPDGTDCVTVEKTTNCVTDNYDVSFPAQEGFQDFTSSAPNYHEYSTPATTERSPSDTREWVRQNPTPGFRSPATPQGTVNDATPGIGGISPVNISPVRSFVTTNALNGEEVVVNVTLEGHPLQSGIVVRQVEAGPDGGSTIQNWGEGNGTLQRPGSATAGPINGVWRGQVPPTGPSPARIEFCQRHPGANC